MFDVQPFPHIRVEGTPSERGFAYGRLAADRIKIGEEIYREAMQLHGHDWAEVKRLAHDFAHSIEAVDPLCMEEVTAIAEGAGVDREVVIVINARSELFNGTSPDAAKSGRAAMPAEGCTSALAYGTATRAGRLLHGQNWDFNARCVESSVILEIKQENGPSLMTFVEAGGLARSGFNDAGIAVTANNLECEQDYGNRGVPLSIIRRRILMASNFARALGAVTSVPRAVSNNMTLSSVHGDIAISLETTPKDVFFVHPDSDGIFAHANHFLSQEGLTKITDSARFGRSPCTYYRDKRLLHHLRKRAGDLTLEDFKVAFSDDFGTPFAVCRPPTRSGSGHLVSTVASVIFDPLVGELHARPAPYDPSTTYKTYKLGTASQQAA